MTLKDLVSKYITSAEHVLDHIEVAESPTTIGLSQVNYIMDSAKAYLKDARHYREKKKFEVSLTSIAYCEGLLDALRLLGAVRFEWPTIKTERKPNRK